MPYFVASLALLFIMLFSVEHDSWVAVLVLNGYDTSMTSLWMRNVASVLSHDDAMDFTLCALIS